MPSPTASTRAAPDADPWHGVRIAPMRGHQDAAPGTLVVDTTSRASTSWERSLSPFHVGPCPLYGGHVALRMENAWQYSKLYPVHADPAGGPSAAYGPWAQAGWASDRANRYPMGRGARPLGAWWDGKLLGYVESRKAIYMPLYAAAVVRTDGWKRLSDAHAAGTPILLRDFDGYDAGALGMTPSTSCRRRNARP